MTPIKIKRKLPLTIQKGNVQKHIDPNKNDQNTEGNFIFIKKIKSKIIPENFYKPISKMITINGNE